PSLLPSNLSPEPALLRESSASCCLLRAELSPCARPREGFAPSERSCLPAPFAPLPEFPSLREAACGRSRPSAFLLLGEDCDGREALERREEFWDMCVRKKAYLPAFAPNAIFANTVNSTVNPQNLRQTIQKHSHELRHKTT